MPVECLGRLDVRQGDTLHILSSCGEELVVEIRRDSPGEPIGPGGIRQWLRTARGSVRLEAGESADDVRMAFCSKKYGVDS